MTFIVTFVIFAMLKVKKENLDDDVNENGIHFVSSNGDYEISFTFDQEENNSKEKEFLEKEKTELQNLLKKLN